MEKRNKKSTKLNREVTDFIIMHSKEGLSQTFKLQSAWEKIATDKALEHTDNICYSNRKKDPGILVYVANSHWAAELNAQKELYRILLERETDFSIPDINFLVTKKAAYKREFKKWREKALQAKTKSKAIPLTEEEDRHTREMVSQIKNEKLRNQLYKAMKADFEWKKGTEGFKLSENPPEGSETT